MKITGIGFAISTFTRILLLTELRGDEIESAVALERISQLTASGATSRKTQNVEHRAAEPDLHRLIPPAPGLQTPTSLSKPPKSTSTTPTTQPSNYPPSRNLRKTQHPRVLPGPHHHLRVLSPPHQFLDRAFRFCDVAVTSQDLHRSGPVGGEGEGGGICLVVGSGDVVEGWGRGGEYQEGVDDGLGYEEEG